MSGEHKLIEHDYGKSNVKFLFIDRSTNFHKVKELTVATRIQLNSVEDYLTGDNSKIVATDTQKNTVHVLARRYGVNEPETFAFQIARHFLQQYSHVISARVHIEETPWNRLDTEYGPHDHAFVHTPVAIRHCTVFVKKLSSGRLSEPTVVAGVRGLRLLKTTKSAFENFHMDDYRTLKDASDRVFSTEVEAKWQYSNIPSNPGACFKTVQDIIIKEFAGKTNKGMLSPSVQNTLYLAQKAILNAVPEVKNVDIVMPNIHYVTVDLDQFKGDAATYRENREVLQRLDSPSGCIHACLERNKSKL